MQARHIAKVIGKICSNYLGLGPVFCLMTLSVYATERLLWFQKLHCLWYPHMINRFANTRNAQIAIYRIYCNPGTEAVDSFTFSWAEDNNWWFF